MQAAGIRKFQCVGIRIGCPAQASQICPAQFVGRLGSPAAPAAPTALAAPANSVTCITPQADRDNPSFSIPNPDLDSGKLSARGTQ